MWMAKVCVQGGKERRTRRIVHGKNVLLVRFGGIEQNSTLFVRNEIVTVLGLGKSREIIKPKVCYAI